jgi:hypothetical protein
VFAPSDSWDWKLLRFESLLNGECPKLSLVRSSSAFSTSCGPGRAVLLESFFFAEIWSSANRIILNWLRASVSHWGRCGGGL